MTALRRESPTWLPASEVRGEGIFLRVREEILLAWEAKPEVQNLQREFSRFPQGVATLRKLKPFGENFPGIRLACFIRWHMP